MSQGRLLLENIQDHAHGGERATLTKARTYHDEMLAKFEPATQRDFRTIVRCTNQTGVPGVFKGIDRNCNVYYATCMQQPNSKHRFRSLTVGSKRDDKTASDMAVATRQQMLDEADLVRPMSKTEETAVATAFANAKIRDCAF